MEISYYMRMVVGFVRLHLMAKQITVVAHDIMHNIHMYENREAYIYMIKEYMLHVIAQPL